MVLVGRPHATDHMHPYAPRSSIPIVHSKPPHRTRTRTAALSTAHARRHAVSDTLGQHAETEGDDMDEEHEVDGVGGDVGGRIDCDEDDRSAGRGRDRGRSILGSLGLHREAGGMGGRRGNLRGVNGRQAMRRHKTSYSLSSSPVKFSSPAGHKAHVSRARVPRLPRKHHHARSLTAINGSANARTLHAKLKQRKQSGQVRLRGTVPTHSRTKRSLSGSNRTHAHNASSSHISRDSSVSPHLSSVAVPWPSQSSRPSSAVSRFSLRSSAPASASVPSSASLTRASSSSTLLAGGRQHKPGSASSSPRFSFLHPLPSPSLSSVLSPSSSLSALSIPPSLVAQTRSPSHYDANSQLRDSATSPSFLSLPSASGELSRRRAQSQRDRGHRHRLSAPIAPVSIRAAGIDGVFDRRKNSNYIDVHASTFNSQLDIHCNLEIQRRYIVPCTPPYCMPHAYDIPARLSSHLPYILHTVHT